MRGPQAGEIETAVDESIQLATAIEPLFHALDYLAEVIRLGEPVVESVADHRLASGDHVVLHQHELHGLPGITLDSFDDEGPVWLRVEHPKAIEPRPGDPALGVGIDESGAQELRRRTVAIHASLSGIAPFGDGTDRSCDIVWGVGVSRWRHGGREIFLPVIERLVTIEVGGNNAITIRPRRVGAVADLRGFDTRRTGGAGLVGDSARRILEAIERDGEVSPFVPASFEPVLRVVGSQLDPGAIHLASGHGLPGPGEPLPDATEHLTVSDRWVIFARPRAASFVKRDIERFKDALDRIAEGDGEIPMLARVLAPGASADAPAARRRAPSGVGRPIDIEHAADRASGDFGDLFCPLPCSVDQIDLVRRLQQSDGLVAQVASGAAKVQAIANLVCHHLALGLRVLLVSQQGATLRAVRDMLPGAIRDLTICLTGGDREELAHIEAAVRRLQLIVETLKPRDHADLINRSEHDVIATRHAMMDVDQEVAGIARGTPGFADLPFDLVRKLVADSEAHAWFEDRPHMLLAETGLSLADVDAARDARIRLGSDLLHIDDEIPPAAQLPDPAAVAGMHQNLVQVPEHALTGPAEMTLPRRVVAALGIHGAGQLAADLEALAAAHRVIDDEPWLGPLSPLYSHDAGLGADVAALVDFARDATSQLSRRPAFLARPVETPADTFADTELLDIVERLAAGKKVFTAFARRERRRKPVIDSITVAGFAPADPDGWGHVRDYLAWRRTIHSLNARWRSLAPELGAPSLAADHPHAPHGFEWIVKSVDVAIVAAAIARRNVTAVGPKLMMSPGDVEAMLENAGELQKLAAAVRSAAIEIETSRRELARLNGLFAGPGVLAAAVRDDVLSRIGQDGSDRAQIRENWTRIRERIVSLQGRREDFERIRAVSNALAAAGAPILAGRVMTEAAPPATGDPVLAADWPGAWNWAVLTRRTEESGRDPHLRQLAERRRKLETTLREQLEAVIAARTRSGLVQNMSGPIRQALTIFTIALRNMEAAADGSAAHHHRRTARDALEGCCEGIPCWLVPSWRIAEQLPARFGAFDLVIVDEASRFDVCELTTLLRGRKILVIGDHSRAGPTLRDVDHAEMERIAETILRPLPKTIRPFMRPGSSLHDLVKVLFAGNDIQLEEQIRLGAGPVGITPRSGHARSIVLTTAAGGAHADEAVGAVPAFDPPPESPNEIMHSEADVIVGEIAKAVARLPRSNRQRRTGAVLADTADTADAAPSPASAIPATRPPQHVVASPPWLHDAPPGAGQRRSVSGRRVAVAAVAMLVMVVGATYWLVGPRANSRVAAGGAGPIPHELVPPASAKSADRVRSPRDTAVAPTQGLDRTIKPGPQIAAVDRYAVGAGLLPARLEQPAVLYEEDPADPNGKRYVGGVTWRTESISSASGAPPEVVVKADLYVPGAKTAMAMTFRRNTDRALSASHVAELSFDMPPDSPYVEISEVRGLVMKAGETVHGAKLDAEAAKVTPGYFMVALAAGAQQMQRNLKLLKENSWLDVMIVYRNGSRAVLAIDKGPSGEQAFNEAFAAWGQ